MAVLTAVAENRVWTHRLYFHSTVVQIKHIQTILIKDMISSVLTIHKKGHLGKDLD